MRRREFMLGIAVAPALSAHGQTLKRIGVISPIPEDDPASQVSYIVSKLEALGWINGRTATLNFRLGTAARGGAEELIALGCDVIVAVTSPVVADLTSKTKTIPIVFLGISDPVGQGFVRAMANPGGNATGFAMLEFSTGGKLVPELKSIVPSLQHAVVLTNPDADRATAGFIPFIEQGARVEAVSLTTVSVRDGNEMEQAVERVGKDGTAGLVIPSNSFTAINSKMLAAMALKHRVPSIAQYRTFPELGGLAGYGLNLSEWAVHHERAAVYVDRILRGTPVGDLPVDAPTQLTLTINVKTASALGLTVPPPVLARADIIE